MMICNEINIRFEVLGEFAMLDTKGQKLEIGDSVKYFDEKEFLFFTATVKGFSTYDGLPVCGIEYEQAGEVVKTFAFSNEVWRLE